MSLSESDSSFFCYPLEETLATEVAATISQSLNDASEVLGCSKLILPDFLLHSISQELLHLAASEPCGLRGALIDLCVDKEDQGSLCTVDQIAVDATLVPTFHVTLVLRLESSGLWPKVQKLFKVSQSPQTSARHQNTLRLSTSFRAIKRKLYCSGELLIEECCWPSAPVPDMPNWIHMWKEAGGLSIVFLRQYLVAPSNVKRHWQDGPEIARTCLCWCILFVSRFLWNQLMSHGSYSPGCRWFNSEDSCLDTVQFLSYECKLPPLREWLMYLIVKYYLSLVCFCIF